MRYNPVTLLLLLACLLIIGRPCSASESLAIVGTLDMQFARKPAIYLPDTGKLLVRADTEAGNCNNTRFFYNDEYREFITACLTGKFGTYLIADSIDAGKRHHKSEKTGIEDFIFWFADWNTAHQTLCLAGKHYSINAPLRLICYRRNRVGKGFRQLFDQNIDDRFFLIQNLMIYQNQVVIAGRKSRSNAQRFEMVYDIEAKQIKRWQAVEYGRLLGRINARQLAVYKDGAIYAYDLKQLIRFSALPRLPLTRVYGQQTDGGSWLADANGLYAIHIDNKVQHHEVFDSTFVYHATGYAKQKYFQPSSGAYVNSTKLDLDKICAEQTRACGYKDDPKTSSRGYRSRIYEYCFKRKAMCLTLKSLISKEQIEPVRRR